ADAAVDRDLALVGLLLFVDEPEERRLARAVGPDQADVLAAVDDRRCLDEENLLSVLLADAVEADQMSRSRTGARAVAPVLRLMMSWPRSRTAPASTCGSQINFNGPVPISPLLATGAPSTATSTRATSASVGARCALLSLSR